MGKLTRSVTNWPAKLQKLSHSSIRIIAKIKVPVFNVKERDESLLVLEVVLVIAVGMGTGKILQRNISVFLNGYCVIYHCQNH